MKRYIVFIMFSMFFLANVKVMAGNSYSQNGNVYTCTTDSGAVWTYELRENGDFTINNQILLTSVTEVEFGNNCVITVVDNDDVYKTEIGTFDTIYIDSGFKYFLYNNAGFASHFRNKQKLCFIGSSTSVPSGWAKDEIKKSILSGIYTMNVLEDYHANITREQFCELVVLLYEKTSDKTAFIGDVEFEDTENEEVLKAANLGIVEGCGDGKFCPNDPITREQICAMIVRMLQCAVENIDVSYTYNNFADIDKISKWAIPSVNFAYDNGIIRGIDELEIAPLNNTTCEEALLLIYRVYCKYSIPQDFEEEDKSLEEEDFIDMRMLDEEIDSIVQNYSMYDDVISENDYQNVIDAIDEFAQRKLENDEIEDYYTDEYSVWMKLKSGLEYIFTPNVEGLDLGGEKLSVITCQPFNTEYGEMDDSLKKNGEKATDGIARTMEINFDNIVFDNNYDDYEVTLEVIKNFTDNQIILWHGHGGYNKLKHSYIYVGSVCDEFLLWTDIDYYYKHKEYEQDYLAGRIVFSSSGRVAITHKFIDEYVDSMENSFVYLGTCLSGKDSKLADSFIDKGAKAVIGNSDSIKTVYNQAMIRKVCENLMDVNEDGMYMTLAEAVDRAKEELGENDGSEERDAYPIIFGDNSIRLCHSKMVSIGGRVVDENGNPVENASVEVTDEDGYVVDELDTDRNGGYETSLFTGYYEFTARKKGYYSSQTIGIEIGNKNKMMYFLGDLKIRKKEVEDDEEEDNSWIEGVESTEKKVVVYFEPNGGDIDTYSKSLIVGKKYGNLPVPVKNGYSFDGWYEESDYQNKVRNNDTVVISEDHTLYAKWSENDEDLQDFIIINAYGTLMTGQNYPCNISVYSKRKKLMEEKYGEPYATFLFTFDEDKLDDPGYVVFETTLDGSSYGTVYKIPDEDLYDHKKMDIYIKGYLIYGWTFDVDELN